MRERDVEARLTAGVKRLGGISIKIAPVMAGVPDRLVLLPGGRMRLVELKRSGGRLRPIQEVFHSRAEALGIHVDVVTGVDGVNEWIERES